MEEKKSIFKRMKENWQKMDPESRTWMKAIAVWFVDGVLVGGIAMGVHKNIQTRKIVERVKVESMHKGEIKAYQHILQNDPYTVVDNAFTKLEKQGKAKKINF